MQVPAHIPADRVADVDIYALPGAHEDAQRAWQAIANDHDLVWTPRNGGHWIATSADLIDLLYRDTQNFSNLAIQVPVDDSALLLLPNQADGEMHRAYRAIIEPSFRPAALEVYRRKARELTIELIEGFRPAGGCEFIEDYATVVPLVIFLTMVDLPQEDREYLHAITRVMTHEGDMMKRQEAFGRVIAYLDDKIHERRRNPGDDMLSKVVQARVFDRPLTDDEVMGMSSLLLFGGLDTVASMMGFVMRFLADHPAHRRWIIDNPGRIAFAVEEIMRRHGVGNNLRQAKTDVELDGTLIRAGEYIELPNCVHGLDPRRFDRPLEVDFTRPANITTMTFGAGPHRCPGNNLARIEMRVMVEEWLKRIPDFWVDEEEGVVQSSGGVNGVLSLPLRWKVD